MMKRVLIISPHFPPVNSADMHRVRQSLPYFRKFGWEPVVIAVAKECIEAYSLDPLLLKTIPDDIEVHHVRAFDAKKTRKFGLGSLSMRSFFQIRKKGDELLSKRSFDLVYFSTTAFHVMALGPRWKRKFKVPFILDIQDPWRSDFYLDKPKSERPPKFFIAYNIDKYLEKRTVPHADGIISVSRDYCDTFINRYPGMRKERFEVITFGVSAFDFEVTRQYVTHSDKVLLPGDKINIVYIGRGGHDMQFALNIIFGALQKGLRDSPTLFSKIHCWFAGTSYAPPGQGAKTIQPIAELFGVGDLVTEIPDRIPYFETLYLLQQANVLLVPGSTDTSYTASKIYPYLLAEKPLLAVFYKESSVVSVLNDTKVGCTVVFDHEQHLAASYVDECYEKLRSLLLNGQVRVSPDQSVIDQFMASNKTKQQVDFFNRIIKY